MLRTPRRRVRLLTPVLALGLSVGSLAAGAPAPAADRDSAPVATLAGDQTGLQDPGAVATDAAGNRYVANLNADTVTVYAPAATGNVAPIRTIGGGSTLLDAPNAVTLDAQGRLYVAVNNPTWAIHIFAPGANGNAAPVGSITGAQTGLAWASGLDVDAAGALYVANRSNDSVTVYAPGATGDVAPIRTIKGAATGLDAPWGVGVERNGTVHVANQTGDSITSYSPGANGDVAPARTIAGPATGLTEPTGLAVDGRDNLYVANGDSETVPYSVGVWAPTAAPGNTAPAERLAGAATTFGAPYGIAVDAQYRVHVAISVPTDKVLTFGPLVALPPAAVTKLRVKGAKNAPRRKVRWVAPASNGGAPITGYVVTVKKKSKVLLTKTVTRTKVVLKRKKLKRGKLTVSVVAVNAVGSGPAVTKKFKVV